MTYDAWPGNVPEIEELFPSRPLPVKRTPHDEPPPAFKMPPPPQAPVASGAGLFTPDAGTSNGGMGNLFRKHDVKPLRLGPRDSMSVLVSFSYTRGAACLPLSQSVERLLYLSS